MTASRQAICGREIRLWVGTASSRPEAGRLHSGLERDNREVGLGAGLSISRLHGWAHRGQFGCAARAIFARLLRTLPGASIQTSDVRAPLSPTNQGLVGSNPASRIYPWSLLRELRAHAGQEADHA